MCLKKAVLLDLGQGRRGPSSKLYTVFGVGIVGFFLTENNINTHIYVILIISLCNILRFKGPI